MRLFFQIFILLFINALLSSGQTNNFITLEGRQFKNGSQDFYPMVINYNVDILKDASSGQYFLTPAGSYGLTPDWECTLSTCTAQFQSDFSRIVSMGFNAIRITISPTYRKDPTSTNRVFKMMYWENYAMQYADMVDPYTDAVSVRFFAMLNEIITLAETEGLKVILITGGNGPLLQNGLHREYSLVHNQAAVDDYEKYLKKLASALKNNTGLLAYDLFNEPIWGDLNFGYPNNVLTNWTKEDICKFERQWYDAIKDPDLPIDPNHLITIGGTALDDVFVWDISTLKLDFYSAHIYPDHNSYKYNSDPTNQDTIQKSIIEGMEKAKKMMYWLSQTSPMPWIIGETGFGADDRNNVPSILDANPLHHAIPYMWGTEAQQDDYASLTLDAVRNFGGSGYSWWQYQNVYWFRYTDAASIADPGIMQQNYQGVLHFGDGTSVDDKPVVTTFQNYFTNGQPPAIIPQAEPDNYRNLYNTNQLNLSHANSVSGNIVDENGNPVANAVIEATNWLKTVITDPILQTKDFYQSSLIGFSDVNGDFEVVPFNYISISSIPKDRITHLKVSAIGGERQEIGYWSDQQLPQSSYNIILKKIITGFDVNVSNETVNLGVTKNYYGWNSLTVNDLILNGTSDLTARNQITINDEFVSSDGSEVHIFTTNDFNDCAEYQDFKRKSYSPSIDNSINSKEIEVSFSAKEFSISVFPNPNSGSFKIEINNPNGKLINLNISNSLGELVWTTSTLNNQLDFNHNNLTKGIYIICVQGDEGVISKKIIIQ